MSFQAGGSCVMSEDAWLQWQAARLSGQVVGSGTDCPAVVNASAVAGGVAVSFASIGGASCPARPGHTVALTPVPCSLVDWSDLVPVWAAVLGLWASVWVVRRALIPAILGARAGGDL